MRTPLDRLIARVVGGRHDIRAPKPTMFERDTAGLEEWPGEIDSEVVAPRIDTRPVRAEFTAAEPAPPARRQRHTEAADAREPQPLFARDTPPPRSEPPRRDPVESHVSDDPGPLFPPAMTARHEKAGVPVLLERRVAAPVPRRTPSPPPRRVATAREPARRVPPPAPQRDAADTPVTAEPSQITIDIGRIEVAGPAPSPRRMLTLDAYLAARRDGTR